MDNYFEQTFELRYSEMNKFGEASTTTILTLLEETAADHCHSIGRSLYDLKGDNIGWVLLSGIIEMYRYPIYKEKITIRTWISSNSDIRGFRENILFDESGEIIGKSKGLWVFFDINKRRPARIFEDIKCGWENKSGCCLDHDVTQKIMPLHSSANHCEFKVNKFDIDSYKHVNNIKYLQWLIESQPKELTDNYYLYSIDGRFMSEAQYGDTLLSFTDRDGEPNSFVHTIKTLAGDKICATAKTIWKKREI